MATKKHIKIVCAFFAVCAILGILACLLPKPASDYVLAFGVLLVGVFGVMCKDQ